MPKAKDPEVLAMQTIALVLLDLPEEARDRVVRWTFDRFSKPLTMTLETAGPADA